MCVTLVTLAGLSSAWAVLIIVYAGWSAAIGFRAATSRRVGCVGGTEFMLALSEFLFGPRLTHEVKLRNRLLTRCVTTKSLLLSELLGVLERLDC